MKTPKDDGVTGARPSRSKQETQRLFHELEVHQIELELQNEELRTVRDNIETVLEKYTDLYDFAPIGYLSLDRTGIIRNANIACASLLGIERSRLQGRSFNLFVTDEYRHIFSEFLAEVFASQTKQSCQVKLSSENNETLFGQMEGISLASGLECRIAVMDITERRRSEEALAENRRELSDLNKTLETRILRAVEELRLKDQMLIQQARMAAMGDMINNIAHQWRQPLNTLGLVVQQTMLFHDTPKFSRDFLQNNTDKAMKLIQHMSATIDDFRDFFKSDKEPAQFDVNEILEKTIALIEQNFQHQKINVILHSDGEAPATGYPNEYGQVILNILTNARDVLIERNIDHALISLRSYVEGDKTVVTITDNAGGVDEAIMDRLFEPYFTTKGPDKGTGIGLFMSKTIIEQSMGGTLTMRNTGTGAEFRIEI
ncbi:MAG: hypothetical protein A2076_07225 [Geobacteraceae bacterium GWC2_53_11]|nr:MAG: hypothetical protein A2076_07225 [Geobacteraceae bacterium GWC2_53_11]